MSHTILIINPNSSRRTTVMMSRMARACLADMARDDIVIEGMTAPDGPAMLTQEAELEQSALLASHPAVLHRARKADGIIVGAFGDPGADHLSTQVSAPVIGIGYAAMQQAAASGQPFGIATTTPGLEQSITKQVHRYGWSQQFTGVRLTATAPLLLAQSPDSQNQELEVCIRACIEQDGAHTVIIGGGPLAQSALSLQNKLSVPIINPITAACQLMAQLLPD